jgi:hypothetical protein
MQEQKLSLENQNLTRLGYVSKLCGKGEQSSLVFYDVLVEALHWGIPWAWCPDWWCMCTSIKTEFPFLLQGLTEVY